MACRSAGGALRRLNCFRRERERGEAEERQRDRERGRERERRMLVLLERHEIDRGGGRN